MFRTRRLSFVPVILLPLLVLHCGSKTETPDDSLGGGSTSVAGAGGTPGIGGAFGIDFGGDLDGDDFGQGGTTGSDAGVSVSIGCGDSIVQSGEACDDGNSVSGDGCAANCASLELDFACPVPGEACVSTVACGDGIVTGDELCDDRNQVDGDGCSADCRQVSDGWSCPVAGVRCEAASCGDGIISGFEECDFGTSVDGCTECKIDDGFDCDGVECAETDCGNGVIERGEQCDDHNTRPFDGCQACRLEPVCVDGVCEAACGDGQRFGNEACDDGNNRDGDGCSATCTVETGYACVPQSGAPPATLDLPIVFRDFIGQGNSLRSASGCYNPVTEEATLAKPIACFHIDFNELGGNGVDNVVTANLGDDGRPVYSCPAGNCNQNPGHLFTSGGNTRPNFNGAAPFSQWYDSSSSSDNIEILDSLPLTRNQQGTYVFDAGGAFYRLDTAGWVGLAQERLADSTCQHNVSFTSETRFWFEYEGGEEFAFIGDDDLWVFVNGKLTLDLGGLHGSQSASFALDADTDAAGPDTANGTANVTDRHAVTSPLDLGLNVGGVYEVALFHAERNECGSNFKVTMKDFNKPKSVCSSPCGDGIVANDELCDDGPGGNDGAYGHCDSTCLSRGHYCGDGLQQGDQGEACDDGQNLSGYGQGCAPGCQLPATCGDGEINTVFGEECDDGANDGSYAGCTSACQLAPRCGDGERQTGEGCDDGNLLSNDGCSNRCLLEGPR